MKLAPTTHRSRKLNKIKGRKKVICEPVQKESDDFDIASVAAGFSNGVIAFSLITTVRWLTNIINSTTENKDLSRISI